MAKKRKASRPSSSKASKTRRRATKKKPASPHEDRGEETIDGPRKLQASRLQTLEDPDPGAHRAAGEGQGAVARSGECPSCSPTGVGRPQCRVLADDDDPHAVSRARRVRRAAVQFRRAPHLVAYWRTGSLAHLQLRDTKDRPRQPARLRGPRLLRRLAALDEIAHGLSVGPTLVPALVDRLVGLSLLRTVGSPVDPRVEAMDRLAPWNPEAGFFHMATRDVAFSSPQKVAQPSTTGARPPVEAAGPQALSGSRAYRSAASRDGRRVSPGPEGAEDVAAVFVGARSFG